MKLRFLVLSFMCAGLALAQTQVPTNLLYTFPTVSGTGSVGTLQFSNVAARPANYTIDASVTGTAPSACTFRVEGSADNSVWYGLDTTAPATTSCTASYMEHITSRPVLYLRVNLVTYTAGDGTTKVVFHYTGKQ